MKKQHFLRTDEERGETGKEKEQQQQQDNATWQQGEAKENVFLGEYKERGGRKEKGKNPVPRGSSFCWVPFDYTM